MSAAGQDCLQCDTKCYPNERQNVGVYYIHTNCLMCSVCQTKLTRETVYVCPTKADKPKDRAFCKQHAPRRFYRRDVARNDLRLAFEKVAVMPNIRNSFNVALDPSFSDLQASSSRGSENDGTNPKKSGKARAKPSLLDKSKKAILGVQHLMGLRPKGKKRLLHFKGFSAPQESLAAGANDPRIFTLVGHTADKMDKWDVATALRLDDRVEAQWEDMNEDESVERTRRPDAAERARRPRPAGIVGIESLAADPNWVGAIGQLLRVDTIEQYAASLDGRSPLLEDEQAETADHSTQTIDPARYTHDPIPEDAVAPASQLDANGDVEMAEIPVSQSFKGYRDTVQRRRDSIKAANRLSILSMASSRSKASSRRSMALSVRSISAASIKSHGDAQVDREDIASLGVVAQRPPAGPSAPPSIAEETSGGSFRARTISSKKKNKSGQRTPLSDRTDRSQSGGIDIETMEAFLKGEGGDHGDDDMSAALLQHLGPLDDDKRPIDAQLVTPSRSRRSIQVVGSELPWAGTEQRAYQVVTSRMEEGSLSQITLMWEEEPQPAISA